MTDEQAAELAEPCIGAFNDPAALIAPQLPASWYLRSLLLFRYGQISSIPRFFHLLRRGSES